jgi:O-antigen/teichoic acid export membrane protein
MKQLKPLTVYGFTIFFNAAISFATFSLLTHYLTEVDYGIINLYNSFTVLLMPFIGIGVPFVLSVDYFKMKKDEFGNQFSNAITIPVAACLVFTVLSLLFHQYIQRFTKVDFFFSIAVSFLCLLHVVNEVMLNLFRNKEKYLLFAGYSLAKNIVEVSITVLLVIGLGYTWAGRLSSSYLALIFGCVIILFFIYKWRLFKGPIKKKTIGTILLAGLPFIPERLAIFTLGYSDRFFIDHFSGTADVGYYGAGAQLALIVNLSILTLNNTFYPDLFKLLSSSIIEYSKVKKIVWTFILLSALITFCVIASIPLFFKFFIGPNFQPGKIYAIYLAIGLFFWSIYNVFVLFLLNLKKNGLIMKISILGMLLSLLLNFFSVRQFGAIGATYTSIIVYFTMAVVTMFSANKFYDLKKIFS